MFLLNENRSCLFMIRTDEININMKVKQILEAKYATKANPFVIGWPDYQTNGLHYAVGETQAAPGIYSREEQLAVVARTKNQAIRELVEVWMAEEQQGEYWDMSIDDVGMETINKIARPAANPHEGLVARVGEELEDRDEWINVYPLGTRDFY